MTSVTRTGRSVVVTAAMMLGTTGVYAQRTVEDFNGDWRFAKGEQAEQVRQRDFDDSR